MKRTREGGTLYSDEEVQQVSALLFAGLETDGEHHKQWALAEAARVLGFDLSAHHADDLGTPP
jgi:hypothetical protein